MLLCIVQSESPRANRKSSCSCIHCYLVDAFIHKEKYDTDTEYLKVYLEVPTPIKTHLLPIIDEIFQEKDRTPHIRTNIDNRFVGWPSRALTEAHENRIVYHHREYVCRPYPQNSLQNCQGILHDTLSLFFHEDK